MADIISPVVEDAADVLRAQLAQARPRLRGWLHLAAAPLTLVAGAILVALSPAGLVRTGSTVFAATALVLFAVSAAYNMGTWSPRTELLLRRLDHANIFLLIAGSYTPFALLLLHGTAQHALLGIAWGGALLGVAFKVWMPHAPRWVSTPVYLALGWSAVVFLPQFAAAGAPEVLALLVAGGLLYTVGGVVYGLRRPNPFPAWYGFHEVFHTFTLLAFASHYTGVLLATSALR